MKLKRKRVSPNEYTCDLTEELDVLSSIQSHRHYPMFRHYVLAEERLTQEQNCLAIRVPGGTVGAIHFDENCRVTRVIVDTDYVAKTYPDDINAIMEKYVGTNIEF